MAEKICFLSEKSKYSEKLINYTFYPGFAVSQKQKCIRSLHDSIQSLYPEKRILEISTKSTCDLGVRLSAFNLMCMHKGTLKRVPVENIFQSSKVFEEGGPYLDLLDVGPSLAKQDMRLKTSGNLAGFYYDDKAWPLTPKTIFYDWIYIEALKQNPHLAEALMEYDVFTDIEFNHNRSINCQARSAAIFVSLMKSGLLYEKTATLDMFKSIYPREFDNGSEQISMLLK